jgi:hypothetical protein
MRLQKIARLGREDKLQRHPDLVRSIASPDVVFHANRPRSAVRLSTQALGILDGFARPRRVSDVIPEPIDDVVLCALAEWIDRELLLCTARRLSPSPSLPPVARLWSASASSIRRRAAKVVPARREQLRGRELAVIDGVFSTDEVRDAADCFHLSPFARTVTKGYARDVYDLTARVPFIDCITAIVEGVFPRRRLDLYWAYCNRARYGDVLIAHSDSQKPSVTALYYANARWDDDWGGETLFYGAPDEATVVVAPRPGRVVLFDGQMGHRGGVPSRLCHEGRLSVVVKYWVRGSGP